MESKSTTVLVIDDESEIRTVLERVISREGYRVFLAKDYDSAIEIVRSYRIDVVISDIVMNGKNGLEIAKEIRKIDENIPVILMTGNPDLTTAEEAVRNRAFDYISKPIRRTNIIEVLEKAKNEKYARDRHAETLIQSENENTKLAQRARDLYLQNYNILNATSDCVITFDENLNFSGLNQSALDAFGYTEEEIIGKHFNILSPPGKEDLYMEKVEQLLKRKSKRQIARINHADLKNKNGEVRTYDISGCYYDIEGKTYYTGIARDITNKILISEKLIDAERRAFLSTLASSIGHEINNSLTAIQGHIEIAKLPDSDDQIRQKAIQITWGQLIKLKTLTNNLLQLGKPGEGPKKSSERIDLNESVEVVIDVFQKTSRLKDCRIHFKPDPLPVMIESDQDQLSLLLSNIMLNSADATGNRGNITISVQIRNHHPVVSILDDGIGMNEEVIQKIYQPYFTTKGIGKGTGLGMFVAKEIADQYGIRIEIESEPDSGTEFRLIFPDKV
ncbi:response regulator [Leptospira gomenensis]|uniref:histidine kinase n=1 Tax=Leptospira gomenensis TaxID=2484974 RepID=A0A5F1YFE0_9LEPT|nr:response regulator [Leptospira gomenensis]TGK34384.1 response regulator [Leptospira gomenensis]TGK37256.1 response regulator [Leptospira gomenensis]TGK50943.1 response regulator [Leptospira gomenensis]TGK56565.1 response regulator [Leptospira gomenensis]